MKQYSYPDETHLNERLRRSLDSMIDPFVLLKPVRDLTGKTTDFIYEYVNIAAAESYGTPQELVIGQSLNKIFPEHKTLGLLDKYINVAETGTPLKIESFKYDGILIDRKIKGTFDILATKLDDEIAVSWHNVTNYNEVIDRLIRQNLRSNILAELTEKLSEAALDYRMVLNTIAERTATLIGDACIIGLISDDGQVVECASLFHKDPEAKRLLNKVVSAYNHKTDEAIVGEAILSRSTVFIPFVNRNEIKNFLPEAYFEYIDTYGIFSLIIVPLKVYMDVIGIILLFRDSTEEPYNKEDIMLVEEIAIKAALAIYNARLYHSGLLEIEDRKKAEEALRITHEKLEDANRELQMFAYVTSHDLKEPLRMISGFLELLSRRYGEKLDAKAKEFISHAVDGAKRLDAMVNEILEYSRVVTRGKEFKEIDANQALEGALKNLSGAIVESNAKITSEKLPVIKGDMIQIQRVFQNFISNAVKFRGSEPLMVKISSQTLNGEWVFSVQDNGIGINKEQYGNIFMLFRRLYPETYSGTGSGLAISKRIIDRHGGRIWVESEEGKGSTFFFSIPKE